MADMERIYLAFRKISKVVSNTTEAQNLSSSKKHKASILPAFQLYPLCAMRSTLFKSVT